MENKYENIDPQNEQIFNLIQEEFHNENIQEEIKLMVANRIKETNFSSLVGVTKLTGAMTNTLYYIMGIVLVAGAISVYYLTSKHDASQEIINDNTTLINEDIKQQPSEPVIAESPLNSESVDSNANNDLLTDNNSQKINKSSETELISVESKEYQHSQTIAISLDLTEEYIKTSFSSIFKSLDLNFNNQSTVNYIYLKSNTIFGKFDGANVEINISLMYSKIEKNKIVAKLSYKQTSEKVMDYNVNELFYESLTSELQKYF